MNAMRRYALPVLLALAVPMVAYAGAEFTTPGSHVHALSWDTDFINSTAANSVIPFYGVAAATGTAAIVSGTATHPGVLRFSTVASANSGYSVGAGMNMTIIGGGEEFSAVFNVLATAAPTNTARMGIHNSANVTSPTNGCFLGFADGVATGKCVAASGGVTSTASTYTITLGTWYRMLLAINSTATLATFTIYSEAGAVLWTDTVAADIPVAAGETVGPRITVINSQSAGIIDILDLDYMRFTINRQLAR